MALVVNWDHLRTFEAVARLGSLTAASVALGVSQSTVSRQLSRLEESAGSPLLLRESPVRLTERGDVLLAAIEPMLDAALSARAALEHTPELRGQVTITTVGELVRWVLVEQLATFYADHPALGLRILADNQLSSLAAGEADVSLRLMRPERGDLIAQKVFTESYGLFISGKSTPSVSTPWLGLTGSLSLVPEQRHAERVFASRPPRLLVEDVESLGGAVESGLGVAVLPLGFASRLEGLVEVVPGQVGGRDVGPIPSRALWLVVHRSKQHVPKIRAVIAWLNEVFENLDAMAP